MRNLGVGITNVDLNKIPIGLVNNSLTGDYDNDCEIKNWGG